MSPRRVLAGQHIFSRPARALRGMATELGDPDGLPARASALELEASMKDKLSQPGSGRTYKSRGITSRLARVGTKKRAKQLHVASAPGEPPAPDIGEFRRSIGSDVFGDVRRVGTPIRYAAALEFGAIITRTVVKKDGTTVTYTIVLKERPWARPAFADARPRMTAAVVSELRIYGRTILTERMRLD